MSTATLNVIVIQKRMLRTHEAAAHCGRSVRQFEAECPVSATVFANGDKRFDVKQIDDWLDSLQSETHDAAQILAKLGQSS